MCMSETFFCKTLKIVLSVLGSLLVFLIFTFRMGMVCAESDIPEGLAIVEIFKPGIGLPVGKVQLVQGEAIVIKTYLSGIKLKTICRFSKGIWLSPVKKDGYGLS